MRSDQKSKMFRRVKSEKISGHPGGNLLQSSLEVGDTWDSKLRKWNEKKDEYHLRKGDSSEEVRRWQCCVHWAISPIFEVWTAKISHMAKNATWEKLPQWKITKIVATRRQILRLECIKFDFGWGAYMQLSFRPSSWMDLRGPTFQLNSTQVYLKAVAERLKRYNAVQWTIISKNAIKRTQYKNIQQLIVQCSQIAYLASDNHQAVIRQWLLE